MGREERVKEVKKMRVRKEKERDIMKIEREKSNKKKRIKGDNFQNIKSKGD